MEAVARVATFTGTVDGLWQGTAPPRRRWVERNSQHGIFVPETECEGPDFFKPREGEKFQAWLGEALLR